MSTDPVGEALARISKLRERSRKVLAGEPPAFATERFVEPDPFIITPRMRSDAKKRDIQVQKILGEDF